jgi:hypothetical protein
MTIDMRAKKILGHQRNIQRYCRLLATHLTDLERQYLHKRIAEENAELDRLSMQMNGIAPWVQTTGRARPRTGKTTCTN